jgi:N-acylneuraminate cytidylyltransferase
MSNVAIIPARGGSKRIPHKNIKDFLGKPIMAYSIEAAKKSGLFDEVMVSTDEGLIADIARQYGAAVPFLRSPATANDHATINDVLREVLECYEKQGKRFDNVCCLFSTAPLVTEKEIMEAYSKFSSSDFTCLYPVVAFSFPIMRSLKMLPDGEVQMRWPEYMNTRSQDIEPSYHDSGTFYWMTADHIKELVPRRNGGIVMDETLIQDIDNESDWKIAEMKYRLLHNLR